MNAYDILATFLTIMVLGMATIFSVGLLYQCAYTYTINYLEGSYKHERYIALATMLMHDDHVYTTCEYCHATIVDGHDVGVYDHAHICAFFGEHHLEGSILPF
jgi:hypothetical protein